MAKPKPKPTTMKPPEPPPAPKPRKRAKFNPKPKPPPKPPEPPPPALAGGLGPGPKKRGGVPDSAKPITRANMMLLRRAARDNWGVPDQLKNEGLFACHQVLIDPASSRKARMAAVRVLQQADRNDLLAERLKLIKLAQVGADTTLTLAELVRDMVHAGGDYDSRTDDD